MKKTYLVLSLILLLGGCGVFQKEVSSYPDGILFPVEKAGEYLYDGEIIDQIQKKDNRLYFATREGHIFCISSIDNKPQWRLRMPEVPKSPVYIGKNYFFVIDVKNNVYCFDLDGNTLWQLSQNEEITTPLVEIGNSVFLGTSLGSFIAIDSLTGNEVWQFTASDAVRSNPVEYEGHIIIGCDDSHLYFLDYNGNLVDKYLAKDKILDTLLVDGKFLYFGTENHFFVCFDLKRKIKKWEVKTGGRILPVPVSDEKRVFFLAWNNVLYCLNKGNGSILWWRPIPSRSPFPMEIYKDKIVVSSLSSTLVCFDVETGARVGNYDVGNEMKSNPLWNSPFLIVNVFDRQTEKGKIIQMKKVVELTLESSAISPQYANQEILLSATTVGFHLPQYEFYVLSGEEKNVVQAVSEESTWSWFPSQPGPYTLGVTVSDEKINKYSEIPFVIETKATLMTPRASLQGKNEKITFRAGSDGFSAPQFEFRNSRVNLTLIGKRSVLSIVEQNIDDALLEDPETGNMIWNPKNRGIYKISLSVSDDISSADDSKYFLILTRDELKTIGRSKKALLDISPPSPRIANERINISADTEVFNEPQYELQISKVNLVSIGKRSVLSVVEQDFDGSELENPGSRSWIWTPKKRGFYMISLIVSAESESANLSKYFLIINRAELKELNKSKKASLNFSPLAPYGEKEKIVLGAGAEGFFNPLFELQINRVNLVLIGKRTVISTVEQNMGHVVSEDRESGNWIWTPPKSGLYSINLFVSDSIEHQNISKYIKILPRDELKKRNKLVKLTFDHSPPTPQWESEKIILNADSEGLDDPVYELQISRVNFLSIGKRSLFSIVEQNRNDFILENPESGNWIWTPTNSGLYMISLFASDGIRRAYVLKYFKILAKDEAKSIIKIIKERAP